MHGRPTVNVQVDAVKESPFLCVCAVFVWSYGLSKPRAIVHPSL